MGPWYTFCVLYVSCYQWPGYNRLVKLLPRTMSSQTGMIISVAHVTVVLALPGSINRSYIPDKLGQWHDIHYMDVLYRCFEKG